MDDRDILQVESTGEHAHRRLLVRVFLVSAFVCLALLGAQFYFGVFKVPELQLSKTTVEDDPDAILKAKDTDSDGISDYDESNLYGTSPYLADSDSDGSDDRTELLGGTDPNCPRGKSCSTVTEILPGAQPDVIAGDPGQIPSSALDSLQALVNMSPAAVRELMRQNGVTEEVLSKLSDEDLMKAYQEALTKSGVSGVQKDVIPKNPTAAEIRKMLVDSGMSQKDADALTDAELTKLYQETLSTVDTKQQ